MTSRNGNKHKHQSKENTYFSTFLHTFFEGVVPIGSEYEGLEGALRPPSTPIVWKDFVASPQAFSLTDFTSVQLLEDESVEISTRGGR